LGQFTSALLQRIKPALTADAPDEVWAMDFMSDELFDGRPIRILAVVDIRTREGLTIAARANFRAAQIVEVLDGLVQARSKPKTLRVNNVPYREARGRFGQQVFIASSHWPWDAHQHKPDGLYRGGKSSQS
jgi:putative transposase